MAFDVERSQELWREAWGEDPPVGNPGNRVLFENDRVRIWHLEVAPGERTPLHTHMNPYLFVVLESATVRQMFADGTTSDDTDAVGDAVWLGLADDKRTHVLANIDDRRYVNRVIEVLS
jgi:hypothetical protein